MSDKPLTLAERLQEPFDPKSIGWKPQSVKGNRALAVAYIDARDVMNRLDKCVGPENWQTTFEFQEHGVVCHLSICINDKWIVKTDFGTFSDQPDKGDKQKAAVSDALKRAAVQWGIGRYLYYLTNQWADYDDKKRQFVRTPILPVWALPYAQQGKKAELPAAPPEPVVEPEPEETAPQQSATPAPAQARGVNLTLPADSQKQLVEQLHKLDRSWHDPKTKAWASKVLGREIPANSHIGELTQDEADKLFADLEIKLKKQQSVGTK